MENKSLFSHAPEGYDCAQVDEYVNRLRAEYKKVYDYAKAIEANSEKLKKLCRSLGEENEALKAAQASAQAQAPAPGVIVRAASELERIAAELKAQMG